MQKHIKLSILGTQYAVLTDQDADDVFRAAAQVDDRMRHKQAKMVPFQEAKAAIVVALELATDLQKYQQQLAQYEQKIESLLAMLATAQE